MTQAYQEARSTIADLVARFARNLDVYKRDEHEETRGRVEFIDPHHPRRLLSYFRSRRINDFPPP